MSGIAHKELLNLEKQIQENRAFTKSTLNLLPNNIADLLDEINTLKVIISEEKSPLESTKIHIRLGLDMLKYETLLMEEDLREHGLTLTPSGHIKHHNQVLSVEDARIDGLLDGIDIEKILLKEKLKQNGVIMTNFGRFITLSGNVRTVEDLKELNILDDDEIDTLLQFSTKPTGSVSSKQILCTEDVKYLKAVVGRPLTLALAELVQKQPRDPIHYLGHWLYKYRYNQEVGETRKKEVKELEAERERLINKKIEQDMEYATKSCLLDIIFKAHDDASRCNFYAPKHSQSTTEQDDESESELEVEENQKNV